MDCKRSARSLLTPRNFTASYSRAHASCSCHNVHLNSYALGIFGWPRLARLVKSSERERREPTDRARSVITYYLYHHSGEGGRPECHLGPLLHHLIHSGNKSGENCARAREGEPINATTMKVDGRKEKDTTPKKG